MGPTIEIFRTARSYPQACREFRWDLPEFYNIGVDVSDRNCSHSADEPAIIEETPSGTVRIVTFRDLRDHSNRFANVLAGRGCRRGDRIAILLPQTADHATAQIG